MSAVTRSLFVQEGATQRGSDARAGWGKNDVLVLPSAGKAPFV